LDDRVKEYTEIGRSAKYVPMLTIAVGIWIQSKKLF